MARAVTQLNNDLKVLDAEYNKLSDHVASGDRDDHDQKLLNCTLINDLEQKTNYKSID